MKKKFEKKKKKKKIKSDNKRTYIAPQSAKP